MPATKTARKAAPRKGAAAVAETNGHARTIDFRGTTLTLPKVLPGTLYFDLAELEDNGGDLSTQVRLLDSLIGTDQVKVVRAKIAEDRVPLDDMVQVISDLFDSAFAAYDVTPGESSASPSS